MVNLFVNLLNMSLMAGWVALAVIALRLVLRRAPRKYLCFLWALVAIRLLCPFSVESRYSLIPDFRVSEAEKNEEILGTEDTAVITPSESLMEVITGTSSESPATIDAENVESKPAMDGSREPMVHASVENAEDTNETTQTDTGKNTAWNAANLAQVLGVLAWVWAVGAAAMLGYGMLTSMVLHRKIKATLPLDKNIFLCDDISTPFILGVLNPVIYLPSAMEKQGREYVIAHEKAHIRRRDHWWKPLGFVLLSVYWFHPLLWAAYLFFCKDMELACDECVIEKADEDYKKAYAGTLLACCVSGNPVALSPLAFGEVGVKERITSIMNYKKPSFWIVLLTMAAGVAVVICVMTDPKGKEEEKTGDSVQEMISTENDDIKKDAVTGDGGQETEIGSSMSLSYEEAVQKWYELRDYPVLPGTEEWKRYGYQKDIEICNPPEDLLEDLTTREVANLLMHYPLLSQYSGYDYIDFFFDFLQTNCSVYREIWSREDGIEALIKAYEENQPDIDQINQQGYVGFDAVCDGETFVFQFFTFFQEKLDGEEMELFKKAYQNKCDTLYSRLTVDRAKNMWNFVPAVKPDPDRGHKVYYITDLLQWKDKWYELRSYPEPMKYAPSGYQGYSFDWEEYRELMNPPADLLKDFTSRELADLMLRYYDITFYPDYQDVDELFGRLEKNCDILKELLEREDGIAAVLQAYEDNTGWEYPASALTESVLRDGHPGIMAELFVCRFVDRYHERFTQEDIDLYREVYQKKKLIYGEIPVSSAAVQFTTVLSE